MPGLSVGTMQEMAELTLVLLVLPVISIFVAWFLFRGRSRFAMIATTATTFALVSLPLFSQVGFLSAIVASVLILAQRQPTFLGVLSKVVLAPVLVWMVFVIVDSPRRSRLEAARQEFPLESLAPRLNAMARQSIPSEIDTVDPKKMAEATKSSNPTDRWQNVDVRIEKQYMPRTQQLQALHKTRVDQFMIANGFGVSRMPRSNPLPVENLRVPKPAEVKQPNLEVYPIPDPKLAAPGVQAQKIEQPGLPDIDMLFAFHADGIVDFSNPRGFGNVWTKEEVAGFQPHGFSKLPDFSGPTNLLISRIELVSLLLNEHPAVYVSETLPQMEKLKGVKTRPLDEFESTSLEKLKKGEDIVHDNGVAEVRMLGAIRSLHSCTKCHESKHGDLLGAFSYRLIRNRPGGQQSPLTPKPKA